ncbi:MAG: hypothetical protein Q8Q63_02900 [Phaeovulum sp.]|uniref:hypothetical protein n=1 Tax=Phaeovulum sp. TaxID=2934796 RepID=UPI002731D04E|nr:hypothetical protein [Phaeovulum sp.]MDP2064247.1 hypothetical protein [Phaeovulum sp.]MDP3860513.1 hypothetical protein [Phaeovulum sp.]
MPIYQITVSPPDSDVTIVFNEEAQTWEEALYEAIGDLKNDHRVTEAQSWDVKVRLVE